MSNLPDESLNSEWIESLLRSIRPEPGEVYQKRMATAPWKVSLASRMSVWPRRQRLVLSAVIITLLGILLLATPAGSVLADALLHFFSRAQGNTIPIPTEQMVAPPPTRTPAPTRVLELLPADQIVTPTSTPSPLSPLSPARQEMTLLEAEATVGFDLYEPVQLPRDYRLTGIQYDAENQAVHLFYASPKAASGEFFVITQGKNLPSFEVGSNALVETVQLGEVSAEFVRGMWFSPDGSTQAYWEDKAEIYSLRWQLQEVGIEIQFVLNDSFYPAYLERDEMLTVGRSLTRCVTPDAAACQFSQAAAAAGFTPWEFIDPPLGFEFIRTDYRPGQVLLWYGQEAAQVWVLQSDRALTGTDEEVWSVAPENAIQAVAVGIQPAEYVHGQFLPSTDGASAVWDGNAGVERLRWQTDGFWFQVTAMGGTAWGAQALNTLAGQLVRPEEPPAMIQTGTPTPVIGWEQVFNSIEAVEAVAGYEILAPDVLPEGLVFSHARYEPYSHSVMLFYGNFSADLIHANGPVLMVFQQPLAKNDVSNEAAYDSGFPDEAIQVVEVNEYPGKIYRGGLSTGLYVEGQPTSTPAWTDQYGEISLSWATEDRNFSLRFSASSGARLAGEDLIAIAESLH
jgi:hypothetical protein